jgi:CubicO group peptidase (beta-lactamase class C family)
MKLLVLFSLWCALALSAQTLTIAPAVELQFPTAANQAYQLQSSSDLARWQPFELLRMGDGRPARILVPAEDAAKYFQLAVNHVRNLDDLLEPIRATNRVPALACAVIRSNRIVGMGAVGLRKSDVPSAPVTLQDKWHHGSLTKSMTATLAAILVERGQIRWESTLEEVFPSLAASMKPDWRSVRLDWLCSNRGGAPGNINAGGLWTQLVNFRGTPFEGRRLLLERLTKTAPTSTPGTAYEYSNAGFALAGHMLETVAGKPWEDLLTENLFLPLGMTSAGFGVPATPRHIDQPWGHQRISGNNNPIEPGPMADNPPAVGPAGTVHCSLLDLAKYTAFHVAGHRGNTSLLPQAAMVQLHTAVPNNGRYAYGWTETPRPWANGTALTHNGSNVQWYSVIWMAPNREFAVVALCNIAAPSGPNPGAIATDQVVGKMIQTFLTQ